ncbi:MAG: hypothetical protein KJP03_06280, partial [Gammaproteobacteria bacterium]|nr:hypothetical protein [Gammaproteobacteria bacterium]
RYPSLALLLATVPLILLWYDNVVIGLGGTIGEGDLLKGLNTVRFLGHYILLPFAIVSIGVMAKQAGFRWAQPPVVLAAFIALGVYFAVSDLWLFFNSTFYPSCFADVQRYTTHISEATACGPDAVIGSGKQIPPIPAFTLAALKITFGIYLWWKVGYKWLFVIATGALVLFSIPYSSTGGIFSNIGEPIVSAILLLTAVHITRNRDSWQDQL